MAMSTHITSGTLGQAMAPLVFAPFVQQFGLRSTPLLMIPALIALLFFLLRRIPTFDRLQEHHEAGGLSRASTVREASDAALPDRRPAHADRHELLDVSTCASDQAWPVAGASWNRRLDLSDRGGSRRIHSADRLPIASDRDA